MKNQKTILLVDDEETILKAVGWGLEKNNYNVTTVISGQEAIANLHARHYDLVITDLVMTEVDGIEVLKQAKKVRPDIGVIILTGHAGVDSAIRALRLGADDYLQKPCDIDELLHKANQSIEKQNLVTTLRCRNKKLKVEIAAREITEKKLQAARDNLEKQVDDRTTELTDTINKLTAALQTLENREEELKGTNRELLEINTTLSVMLKRRDKEHDEIRAEIATETTTFVLPLLKKAQQNLTGSAKDYLQTAQLNLKEIFAKHSPDSVLANAKLSPRELQVVNYIRQSKSSKEIADLLGLSVRTVESYRETIRKKIGITNQKKSLKKFLTSPT